MYETDMISKNIMSATQRWKDITPIEYIKINKEVIAIKDNFVSIILRLHQSIKPFNIEINKKNDLLCSIIYKSLYKLNLKYTIDIIILDQHDEFKYNYIYIANKIIHGMSILLDLNIKVLFISKSNKEHKKNPTIHELEILGNYFFMVKKHEILYIEGFNYFEYEYIYFDE